MNRNWLIGGAVVILIIVAIIAIARKPISQKLQNSPAPEFPADTSTPEISQTPITGRPQVKITTAKGDITLELRPDLAPKSVANFLAKFNSGYCDGLTFHRIEDWVAQGCDPKGDGTGGGDTLPTEFSQASFVRGSLGVARRAFPRETSNDSQFFILKKDSAFLNNDYTYFGQVISGMDVVDKLAVGDKILSTVVLTK